MGFTDPHTPYDKKVYFAIDKQMNNIASLLKSDNKFVLNSTFSSD